MAYLPIIPGADQRLNQQAATPITFRNVYLERSPRGAAKRAPFFVAPRPGLSLEVTLSSNCRGLFSEPGCQDGKLYSANGSSLLEISSNFGYITVGSLAGGDVVTMRAFRADLVLRALGALHHWNGTTFTTVADADAPASASTIAVVGFRVVAAEEGGDSFSWSRAGDALDWDAAGVAADIDLPDPIIGQEEINGDLWNFGSRSTTPWQATGGSEAEAFARIPGGGVRRGLAGRDLIAKAGDGAMLIGDDRAAYETSGLSLSIVPNRDMEVAIQSLTGATIQASTAWSYRTGSKEFVGFSFGLERCFVLDRDTGVWSEWTRYNQSDAGFDFVARAFGQIIVGSKSSAKLWSLDPDVFEDDGDPIIREFTIHIPTGGDVPIDQLVFDMDTRDVPLSGDGSSPLMQVTYSTDNGITWSPEEDVSLPTDSDRFRPRMWALGLGDAVHGMLVKMRISDPIGFAIWGVFVNPGPNEVTI